MRNTAKTLVFHRGAAGWSRLVGARKGHDGLIVEFRVLGLPMPCHAGWGSIRSVDCAIGC
ncbi:uncharacterized protein TrAFT101_000793 [Trichoderma asperellum]|uniref:uncharacterized protein n=1 Tax=Trichoderma asperellum TaxID=101201 RepID=UPI00332C9DF2|nr:hypothetical protein TrAFT101_000793 [Trichoderma asperellum]